MYSSFRAAILRGELKPNQKLPSSRELAGFLEISRFPVLEAYARLLAEGYFQSRVGSGTFVSPLLPKQRSQVHARREASVTPLVGARPTAQRLLSYPKLHLTARTRGLGAFGVHQPAFEHFPFRAWGSLVARHSRSPKAAAIHNIDPLGSEHFREVLCAYLSTARGVHCTPSQIMIVSGSQQALDITSRVLLDVGSRVWVEEPGYGMQRTVLAAAGCTLCAVPVDEEGMDIPWAIRHHPDARAAFVTPSHQYPLGSTMSAARRLHLLNWAQSRGSWIVEDDYDSEFRFGGEPIPSLQGLDTNARVIYIGTFSKVLYPSIRIGYIVVPSDLVEKFAAVRFAMDIFPPYLFQEVLADFIDSGQFGRHIRKMRRIYSERRRMLIENIDALFGDGLTVHGADAGMHLAVTLPDDYDDIALSALAAEQRLWLWPLSVCYFGERKRPGFVLGFGNTGEKQIAEGMQRMKSILPAELCR